MKVQMSNSSIDLNVVQNSSKVSFPIGGHPVDCDEAVKPPKVALQQCMAYLDGDRMWEGMGTSSRLKGISGKKVKVELAGPSTDKPRFCYQIAQLSIVLSLRIAERRGWPAQQILQPIFTTPNFVPGAIFSELWKWRMTQCMSTHIEGRG